MKLENMKSTMICLLWTRRKMWNRANEINIFW